MSDISIQARGLSKLYRIGGAKEHSTFGEAILSTVTLPLRKIHKRVLNRHKEQQEATQLWAVRDVDLDIHRGEAVGLIGSNGAGKSTLLRILARITKPTLGRAEIRGRMGSLLEVGTGFNPELTGRDNVYFNGVILGMTRGEVKRRFDEIVAFSEVEKFIDTPVKHYSSGMRMRLAFAVAAHLDPEILIIDEVLAVGDANFQKKCLGKMNEVTSQGRTIVFVTHSMQAVLSLCPRSIMMQNGMVTADGRSGDVVAQYLAVTMGSGNVCNRDWSAAGDGPGNDRIRMHRVTIVPQEETANGIITMTSPLDVTVEYVNRRPDAKLMLSMSLYTSDGAPAFQTSTSAEPVWHGRTFPPGLFRSVCRIPGNLLNDGMYRVRILVSDMDAGKVLDLPDALSFTVHDMAVRQVAWFGRSIGPVRPKLNWSTEQLGAGG